MDVEKAPAMAPGRRSRAAGCRKRVSESAGGGGAPPTAAAAGTGAPRYNYRKRGDRASRGESVSYPVPFYDAVLAVDEALRRLGGGELSFYKFFYPLLGDGGGGGEADGGAGAGADDGADDETGSFAAGSAVAGSAVAGSAVAGSAVASSAAGGSAADAAILAGLQHLLSQNRSFVPTPGNPQPAPFPSGLQPSPLDSGAELVDKVCADIATDPRPGFIVVALREEPAPAAGAAAASAGAAAASAADPAASVLRPYCGVVVRVGARGDDPSLAAAAAVARARPDTAAAASSRERSVLAAFCHPGLPPALARALLRLTLLRALVEAFFHEEIVAGPAGGGAGGGFNGNPLARPGALAAYQNAVELRFVSINAVDLALCPAAMAELVRQELQFGNHWDEERQVPGARRRRDKPHESTLDCGCAREFRESIRAVLAGERGHNLYQFFTLTARALKQRLSRDLEGTVGGGEGLAAAEEESLPPLLPAAGQSGGDSRGLGAGGAVDRGLFASSTSTSMEGSPGGYDLVVDMDGEDDDAEIQFERPG